MAVSSGFIYIYSNDGLTELGILYPAAAYDSTITITSEGLDMKSNSTTGVNSGTYTYQGDKVFLGLATTQGATEPTYPVGGTFTFPAYGSTVYYYIVEGENDKPEPPTAEGVKSKLQSLITASNAKTGKSDANLTDAVNTLLEGYGSGDGIFAEQENEHGTTVVLGADLQEKTIDITANGTVEVTPDEGYALKKVTANVNVPKDGVDKIQKYIELSGNKAKALFSYFGGKSIEELIDGVDTSNVTDMSLMFLHCGNLTSVPFFDTSNVTSMWQMFYACSALTSVPFFDTSNVTDMREMFYGCTNLPSVPLFDTSKATSMVSMMRDCSKLTTIPLFDTSKVTSMDSMMRDCSKLTTIPLFDTSKVTNMASMFYGCQNLPSVPALDMRGVTSASSMFNNCKSLTECWIRNIKANLQVSNGTSYGHLLTLESLLHLCKECCKTISSRKLTMGTANLAKLEGIYVKLIDITDDMRAEDDLIDEKYPFVQCESTDEGAMTIQDYMATKMWSLA